MIEPHFEIFYRNLSSIYREVQRIRCSYASKLDIKSVQVFWIFLLKEHPEGMIASQLAQASKTDRSLVSREMGTLIERKLVRYEKSEKKNAYARKMYLTARGRKIADQIDQITMEIQNKVSKEIPDEEMKAFYRVLSALNTGFSEWKDEEIQ
ncbi:MAG: winged helix-turn-helix transcriptional regulator [Erysipelotrichaceae bacterium]|jgi:DNA-binding MarR family transcriptional regulator|nr:winged helix-turn-helix transcriptional regulator [Erysipelotrichaceae bacterium]